MRWLRLLFFALLFSSMASLAQATEDARFQVELHFEASGVTPPIQEQVKQALPILWQRLIPQSARLNMPQHISAMSLLRSIHPQGLRSIVTFNGARVRSFLASKQIPFIPTQPSFHITLDILDTLGRHQRQQEDILYNKLAEQAADFGVQLHARAPALKLQVQWLNDRQFYITMDQAGHHLQHQQNSPQRNISASRQLQQMLLQAMLEARDQFAQQPATSEQNAPDNQHINLTLRIENMAPLSDQIALESDLAADSHTVSITPILIQAGSRTYQWIVNTTATTWLSAWFAQRGMHATTDGTVWLVQ